jgi:hypothetical protein
VKPNKENISKWVALLRSGEFYQAKGMLRDGVARCCLGVACDAYRRSEDQGSRWATSESTGAYTFKGEYLFLPDEVQDWLGIDSDDPWVYMEHSRTLADMNDNGATFPEIADAIEKEWLHAK